MEAAEVAEIDQEEAELREFARLPATYYRSLVTEGMPPSAALEVVLGWQESRLGSEFDE